MDHDPNFEAALAHKINGTGKNSSPAWAGSEMACSPQEMLAHAATVAPSPDNPSPYIPTEAEAATAAETLALLKHRIANSGRAVKILGWRFEKPDIDVFWRCWISHAESTYCYVLRHTGSRAEAGGRGATYWVGPDRLSWVEMEPSVDPIALLVSGGL